MANKTYFKGLEELENPVSFKKENGNEFSEELPLEQLLEKVTTNPAITPRRDFLKTMGFGVTAVTLAACNTAPIRKSIPYLVKPEEITPGIPNYYASTFEGHGVLVKTREGRPIKIDGNPECPISQGSLDAVGQASLLDLYDSSKLRDPRVNGSDTTWDELDIFVKEELAKVSAKNGKIRILSSTINSPSTKAVIADFINRYPGSKHIMYDAVSYSAIINANRNSFDKAVLPQYRFDKAEMIVSFGADFLGTWISPVEFTKQYSSLRNAKRLKENKKMSRHVQFETGMSLTGSNADTRVPVKPSQMGLAILGLYNNLAKKTGTTSFTVSTPEFAGNRIEKTATELLNNKGKSLVICGINDVSIQVLVNAINSMLGNYGSTIDLDNYSNQKAGNEAEVVELIAEMKRGEVGAVFLFGVNPVYNFSLAKDFTEGLKKVALKVSFANKLEETSSLANVIAPDHHYLESWNDAEPKAGHFAMVQPTISPVYNSRAAQQGFINWAFKKNDAVVIIATAKVDTTAGVDSTKNTSSAPTTVTSAIEYSEYIKNFWRANVFSRQTTTSNFVDFWENLLRKGFFAFPSLVSTTYSFNKDLSTVVQTISSASKDVKNVEVELHEKIGIRDGKFANNPWLQELPDPISKVSWDNYVSIAPKFAKELGLEMGNMVTIKRPGFEATLPVLLQPGQALGSISISLGYGRKGSGKVGDGVGVNAFPLVSFINGSNQNHSSVSIEKVAGSYELALSQTHHSYEGRDIVRETTLGEYAENQMAGSGNDKEKPKNYDLWGKHEKYGFHWAMAIDMNACTGCGACVVSCNVENNVAIVGRDEVRRRREMHWIRIDRYYSVDDNGTNLTKEEDQVKNEYEGEVSVIHQPMLCQHCDHAPCESVCPVLASMHSSEGLNQMVYNRCIGTRYCANNCPYKVRRFNWFKYFDNDQFDYHLNDDMGKMVLNPDVTVRSRGVMEKCSMCVQRIQEKKLKAKIEKRKLEDGEIKMACQQTCPANAIVFGDINDPESEVSKALKNERTYYILEELNVQPGIGYMTKVRNKDSEVKLA